MMEFLQLLAVAIVVLGVAYLGLAIALGARQRKHGSCNCSSEPGGSCCRTPDKGQGEGGA
jgi:hypothetical protein